MLARLFFYYHDDAFFGLARNDGRISDVKKSKWTYPTQAKRKRMKLLLKRLKLRKMIRLIMLFN